KRVFLVFVKLRWSTTCKILSKWSVVIKRLENTDIDVMKLMILPDGNIVIRL
ncbi:Uncharacterized protein FWK35_00013811, partial [Aphis craccivora]